MGLLEKLDARHIADLAPAIGRRLAIAQSNDLGAPDVGPLEMSDALEIWEYSDIEQFGVAVPTARISKTDRVFLRLSISGESVGYAIATDDNEHLILREVVASGLAKKISTAITKSESEGNNVDQMRLLVAKQIHFVGLWMSGQNEHVITISKGTSVLAVESTEPFPMVVDALRAAPDGSGLTS